MTKALVIFGLLFGSAIAQSPTWTHTFSSAGPPPTEVTWFYPQCINGTCLLSFSKTGSSGIYGDSLYSYGKDATCTGGITGAGGTCLKLAGWIGTSGSGSCPNNGGPSSTSTWPSNRHNTGMFADHVRNRLFTGWGVCNGYTAFDWWSFTVDGPPLTNASWTQISPPKNLPIWGGATNFNASSVIHDSGDDAYILFGQDGNGGTRTQIFCPTDRNPTPGTLTSAQSTAGCLAADSWTCLIGSSGSSGGSGSGGTCASSGRTQPTGAISAGPQMQYDSVHNKVLLFGGGDASSSQTNAMWVYDPPTKTWAQLSANGAAGVPPAGMASCTSGGCLMTTAMVNGHTLYYHQNTGAGAPADWTGEYSPGSPGTMTWTQVGSGGPTDAWLMTFDSSRKVLVTFSPVPASSSWNIWEAALPGFASTANTITISNPNAGTVTNQPIRIGRAFAQGEIPNGQLPQAVIAGTGIDTQVDVKNRWADNSLKFAVISFLLPSVTYGTSVTVSFPVGTTVGNTALTQAQMLDASYNFDATIQITKSSVSKSASARTMLTDSTSIPDCEGIDWSAAGSTNISACYWTKGPIATTVLLANHANATTCGGRAASKYDFGFDSYCPIRPMYEATFWGTSPGHQVRVRYIGEVTNTEQQENVTLAAASGDSLVLKVGSASPATIYTHSTDLTMTHGSRWTNPHGVGAGPSYTPLLGQSDSDQMVWIGGVPATLNLNHNLTYLGTTKFFPKFDTSKTYTSALVNSLFSSEWQQYSCGIDLYQAGKLRTGACGDLTGGADHPWLGPMAQWTTRWAYTGYWRARTEALGIADLAGALPVHFREGNAAKNLLANGVNIWTSASVPGVGRVVSIESRPLLSYANTGSGYIGGSSNNGSAFQAVGTTGSSFNQDPAHEVQIWAEYALTGDPYYLDEAMFQAGWTTWWYQYADTSRLWRGPAGAGGLFARDGDGYQSRGMGFANLQRVNTWLIIPDAMAEKSYFDMLNKDAIARWEGERLIAGGSGYNPASYTYGSDRANDVRLDDTYSQWASYWGGTHLGIPALHWWQWDQGHTPGQPAGSSQGFCDNSLLSDATIVNTPACGKMWMYDFITYSIGRASEVGYNTTKLMEWIAVNYFGQVTNAGYNPFLVATYFTPLTTSASGTEQWLATWADVKNAFVSSAANETSFGPAGTIEGVPGNEYSGEGYAQPFAAAASHLVNQDGGGTVWTWLAANVTPLAGAVGCSDANTCDLRWAILPRSVGSSSASCAITTASLPNGKIGVAYSQTLAQSNCNASSWALASGSIAACGLTLNTSTGVISGTPSTATPCTFTASYDTATSSSLSITINGATSVTDDFNRSSLGTNWTVDVGAIGINSSLYANQSAGTGYAAMHWAADTFAANQYAETTIYLQGSSAGSIGPLVRLNGTSGYACLATNSTGPVSLVRLDSGTIGATLGAYAYTAVTGDVIRLEVTDTGSRTALACKVNGTTRITHTGDTNYASGSAGIASLAQSRIFANSWAGGDIVPACSISPTVLSTYTAGQSVSQQFTATNCNSSTFTVSAGSLTGSGLSLSSSGRLSGTALAGSFSFTVAYDTTTDPLSLTTNPAPSITNSGALAAGTVSQAYSQALTTSGGTGALTCSLASGSMPTGLSFTGCTIGGTPGVAGTYNFTAKATDGNSVPGGASSPLSIVITAADLTAPVMLNVTPCGGQSFPGSCTIPATTTGSLLAIAIVSANGTSPTISSIAAAGGSCQEAGAARSTDTSMADLWYCTGVAAGTTSLTITPNAPTSMAAMIWEFTAVARLDTSAVLNSQAASNTPTGAPVTARAKEVVISIASPQNSITGINAGNACINDSLLWSKGWAHYITSSPGSVVCQWTGAFGTYNSSTAVFMFESPSAGPVYSGSIVLSSQQGP